MVNCLTNIGWHGPLHLGVMLTLCTTNQKFIKYEWYVVRTRKKIYYKKWSIEFFKTYLKENSTQIPQTTMEQSGKLSNKKYNSLKLSFLIFENKFFEKIFGSLWFFVCFVFIGHVNKLNNFCKNDEKNVPGKKRLL